MTNLVIFITINFFSMVILLLVPKERGLIANYDYTEKKKQLLDLIILGIICLNALFLTVSSIMILVKLSMNLFIN